MFLKCLLDLGDYDENEGGQWVKKQNDEYIIDLNFVVVRFIRPEFGLAEFYGWLILFYILAMVFEVVLLREKFSILTQSTVNSLQDSQVSESTAGKL